MLLFMLVVSRRHPTVDCRLPLMRSSSTMMRSFIMLRYLGALFKAKHPGTCRSSGVPWEDPIVRPVV